MNKHYLEVMRDSFIQGDIDHYVRWLPEGFTRIADEPSPLPTEILQ